MKNQEKGNMNEERLSREANTEMSELSDKDFKVATIPRGSLKGNFNCNSP